MWYLIEHTTCFGTHYNLYTSPKLSYIVMKILVACFYNRKMDLLNIDKNIWEHFQTNSKKQETHQMPIKVIKRTQIIRLF